MGETVGVTSALEIALSGCPVVLECAIDYSDIDVIFRKTVVGRRIACELRQ